MIKIKGQIVDVVNRRIFSGELEIVDGKINQINEVEHDNKQFIIPGFVDAHVHVESSMLIPSEFARLAVCHGTVATISDPHEIGNVLGKEGALFWSTEELVQVDIFFRNLQKDYLLQKSPLKL